MDIIQSSWQRIFSGEQLNYTTKIRFSGHFKDFNANIRLYNNQLELRLCRRWKTVNQEILIGLIQSLLLKLLKKKANTINIDLYNSFVKNLHITVPKNNIEPVLEQSFNRVNEKYFYNSIEIPNLVWGQSSVRKLGCYDYKTDTVSMSSILKNSGKELLDYVMYHELLHKKHKFSSKNGRNRFHTNGFRQDEKAFENAHQLEKQLQYLRIPIRKPSFISKIFRL